VIKAAAASDREVEEMEAALVLKKQCSATACTKR
jgi:hypothetical protein